MLRNFSHIVGTPNSDEILYDTPFGYMFNYLCHCQSHLLPEGARTIHYLLELGKIMADMGTPEDPKNELDSNIPAIYTYLGQFIDHDITARTDRNADQNDINDLNNLHPLDPDNVVNDLTNGRRPQLDLDSVFGEGPSLNASYQAQADDLFDNRSLSMHLNEDTDYIDVPRHADGRANIADARNDENLLVSQLHAAFIKMYNRANTFFEQSLSNVDAYCEARRHCRWAYQYVVIHDYLNQVCDSDVVKDVLVNGPYFYTHHNVFMPLEFSVAGFRFGHSMIRPFYTIRTGEELTIMNLLGTQNLLNEDKVLPNNRVIQWSNLVGFEGSTTAVQNARLIDPKLAKGLFDLSGVDPSHMPPNVLASLTTRNLLRGYLLSIPVGQSIAEAMRTTPLTANELTDGLTASQRDVLTESGFTEKTPLWYYVLQEAKVKKAGNSLGYVGSKLVAETLIGLVKNDPNSYWNNRHHASVSDSGITIDGQEISTIADILAFAGVPQ